MGLVDVDAQEPVTVRVGAGAAAARLDAEQVVEQRDHEIVVQELAARRPDHSSIGGVVPDRVSRHED
jgi:hypothetical protein